MRASTPDGRQLGPYRILSQLGAGGMGEVYLAEDTRLHRNVALKVLPHAAEDDEPSRRRLIREAQAAATLDHANICTVYEIGEADGCAFIAMQYVQGETLAATLKQGALDRSSALAIAARLAAALCEAHRYGIVHRDVKPQNIMLTAGNQVKVLDFGLAKFTTPLAHDAHTATVLTQAGAVTGTAPYMSPEQIRGESLDPRTDVFSFGCVLYEMLARLNPFLQGNAADTMAAVLTREPPPLPEGSVPAELQRIVRKCLEKDRDRRYQTMRDVAIDLDCAVSDMTAAASRPPTVLSTEPRPASWRGVRSAVLSALGVLLVGGAAAAAYLYLHASAPAVLSPADFVPITGLADIASSAALSSDGRMVAFMRGDEFLGTGQIYVKLLPNGDAVQLTNDPRSKYGLTFTPDGSRIAYTVVDQPATRSMSWDTWTVLLGGFAGLAILLASIGVFGVLSYFVTQRTREIGIRVALGASSADVMRMIVGRGLLLAAVGLGLGLAAAIPLTRSMQSLLFEVKPLDWPTLIVVTVGLCVVAAFASYLPARRALRIEPMTALTVE